MKVKDFNTYSVGHRDLFPNRERELNFSRNMVWGRLGLKFFGNWVRDTSRAVTSLDATLLALKNASQLGFQLWELDERISSVGTALNNASVETRAVCV